MKLGFKTIPAKEHKPGRKYERKITSRPKSYKPRPYSLSTVREAKPIPHKRIFSVQKKAPMPKSPYRYKYKRETNINGKFVLLLLLLLILIGGFIALLMFLLKR